jgi:hypothetical protein
LKSVFRNAFPASVSLVTFSQPSFSPRFSQLLFSNAAASLESTKLVALSATTLPTLMRVALITLLAFRVFPSHVGGPDGDDEPHLIGLPKASAGGLDRHVKRQCARWMADRQNRCFAGAKLVRKVERTGIYRLSASRRLGLSNEFLRNFGVVCQEFPRKF